MPEVKRQLSWEYIEHLESELALERAISDNLQRKLDAIGDFNAIVEDATKIDLRTIN